MEEKHTVMKFAIGVAGTTASFSLHEVSIIVSILAGLATTIYMVLNIIHRWRRLRQPPTDKTTSDQETL